MEQNTHNAKKEIVFEESSPHLGGITSMNNDLRNMSDEDFFRTVVFVIIGIFIVLVFFYYDL